MITITSQEELRGLLSGFTFEDIGFIKMSEVEPFIEYYKKRPYRADLYVKVDRKHHEAQVYRCTPAGQPESKIGTFNIRMPDELLFLLTHGLNELRVEQSVLHKYKREIGYDQTNVIPARLPR